MIDINVSTLPGIYVLNFHFNISNLKYFHRRIIKPFIRIIIHICVFLLIMFISFHIFLSKVIAVQAKCLVILIIPKNMNFDLKKHLRIILVEKIEIWLNQLKYVFNLTESYQNKSSFVILKEILCGYELAKTLVSRKRWVNSLVDPTSFLV